MEAGSELISVDPSVRSAMNVGYSSRPAQLGGS